MNYMIDIVVGGIITRTRMELQVEKGCKEWIVEDDPRPPCGVGAYWLV